MPRRFPRVDRLIHKAERIAAEQINYVEMVTAVVQAAIDHEADPYLLTAAMVEGIDLVLAEQIPQEKRHEVAVHTARLIGDRLRAHGVLD